MKLHALRDREHSVLPLERLASECCVGWYLLFFLIIIQKTKINCVGRMQRS